jgi:hypothetical protein
MSFANRVALGAALAALLMVGGCSSGGIGTSLGGMFGSSTAPPPAPVASMAPITTASGVQQFSVPADGRALLARRLVQLVPGPIADARISNGWRTAASANATPNDYAACISATTGGGTQTFMVVKSGEGTGDVKAGAAAAAICGDPARVVQWVQLGEAVAMR